MTSPTRRIDHLVVAAHDLERTAGFYRKLGFQVGARNQHPWGTENRLVQFGSSFIELITVGAAADHIPPHQPRRFSFGAFVRDFLQQREGIAMLVLSSADARSAAAQFAQQGIGDFEPFFFERKGKGPDGAETRVAFTLAFASDPAAPDAGFFACEQHFPKNFWNSSFQQHANSAMDIAAVTLSAPDPHRHEEFLSSFTGAERESLADGSMRFALDRGRIEVAPASGPIASPLLTSFAIRVADLDCVDRLLCREAIPFTTSGNAIAVAPHLCFSVEIRFETQKAIGKPARYPLGSFTSANAQD